MPPLTPADSNGPPLQNSRQHPRHGDDNSRHQPSRQPNQHDRFRQHQNRTAAQTRTSEPAKSEPLTSDQSHVTHTHNEQLATEIQPDAAIDSPHQIVTPEHSPFADSVTTAEALRIYEQAGQPRSERSLQRYCADGSLDCHKSYDQNGMTYYLIDRASIARHIDKLKTTAHLNRPPRTPAYDLSTDTRPATFPALSSRTNAKMEIVLTQLSQRLADTSAERDMLREQLTKKDLQIDALNQQQLATTGMIQSLQRMIESLTGYLPKPKSTDQ